MVPKVRPAMLTEIYIQVPALNPMLVYGSDCGGTVAKLRSETQYANFEDCFGKQY